MRAGILLHLGLNFAAVDATSSIPLLVPYSL